MHDAYTIRYATQNTIETSERKSSLATMYEGGAVYESDDEIANCNDHEHSCDPQVEQLPDSVFQSGNEVRSEDEHTSTEGFTQMLNHMVSAGGMGPRLVRYRFTKAPLREMNPEAAMLNMIGDQTSCVQLIEFYRPRKVAVVHRLRNGYAIQEEFQVEPSAIILQAITENGLQIRTHYDMSRKC